MKYKSQQIPAPFCPIFDSFQVEKKGGTFDDPIVISDPEEFGTKSQRLGHEFLRDSNLLELDMDLGITDSE